MSDIALLDLLDRHLAAENSHDLVGTIATVTPDCEFVDHALRMRWTGHSGAAAHYTMWWNAFDIEVIGERLHMAGESAVAETTWRGTHVGDFCGIAATSRPVQLSVAVVISFRDGLLAGERFYWDRARLAEQMGVAHLDTAVQSATTATLVGPA